MLTVCPFTVTNPGLSTIVITAVSQTTDQEVPTSSFDSFSGAVKVVGAVTQSALLTWMSLVGTPVSAYHDLVSQAAVTLNSLVVYVVGPSSDD